MKKMILFTAVLTLLVGYAAKADIAVVAASGNAESSISDDAAKNIFLGKAKAFPGGANAKPCDQAEGSAIRNNFYQKLTGKSADDLKAYWSKLIFTGKGTPPEAVDGDAGVKAWLGKNADGICYIDSKSVDGSVKVLYTVK